MASAEQICSMAMGLCGKDPITDMNDTADPNTVKCRSAFPILRDTLLRVHAWGFATRRVTLERLSAAPASGYAYQYELPADCLQVQAVNEDDGNDPTAPRVPFTTEYGRVLTNAEAVVLKYTANVEEPGRFDSTFVECLAARIAATLVYPITGNADLTKALQEFSDATLQRAKIANILEGIPQWADAVYRATMGFLAESEKAGVDEWKIATKFRAVYAAMRDALLREHSWNFAIKRTAVLEAGTAQPGGYTYAWTLPTDCLRVLAVNEDDGQYPAVERVPFAVENGQLLTNAVITA